MISFKGGPAEAKILNLSRAPYFLRVVIDKDGKVDALDQVEDVPKDDEAVYVYLKYQDLGSAIFCSRNPSKCTRVEAAEYWYSEHQQPSDKVLRNNTKWQTWCQAWAENLAGVNDLQQMYLLVQGVKKDGGDN